MDSSQDQPSHRDRWLQDVEAATFDFRLGRAFAHEKAAEAATDQQRESSARWHRARARGQRQRFERVRRCCEGTVMYACSSCGEVHHEVPETCDAHRVCFRCKIQRRDEYRERFSDGRKVTLRALRPALRGDVPGGKWSEKFLTLTYPDSGVPSQDVLQIYCAWPAFIRRVRRFCEWRGVDPSWVKRLAFVRVLEVTPGDAGGHAHLHVWMVTPWLSHVVLRALWARSLDEAAQERLPRRSVRQLYDEAQSELHARDVVVAARDRKTKALHASSAADLLVAVEDRELPYPVLDVRRCGDGIEAELVKYMLKDIDSTGQIDPHVFATLYEALEARRCVIACRGFWQKDESKSCCGRSLDRVRVTGITSADARPPDPAPDSGCRAGLPDLR